MIYDEIFASDDLSVPDEICLAEIVDPVEGDWDTVEQALRIRLRVTEEHQNLLDAKSLRGMLKCLKEDYPEDADLIDHMTVQEITSAFVAQPTS